MRGGGNSENSGLLQFPQNDQGLSSLASASSVLDSSAISSPLPLYQKENQEEPSFVLRDLVPGNDYTLVVYAVNRHGRSLPVLMENVKISREDDKKGNNPKFDGSALFEEFSKVIRGPEVLGTPLVVIGLISKLFSNII